MYAKYARYWDDNTCTFVFHRWFQLRIGFQAIASNAFYPSECPLPSRLQEHAPHCSSPDLLLLKVARCISLTRDWTTSDIGGRNSISGYPQYKTKKPWKLPHTIDRIGSNNQLVMMRKDADQTCTHSAIMSANRDKDLAGYIPIKEGSTILARASISWSWGVAHLTRDCSALGLVLQIQQLSI